MRGKDPFQNSGMVFFYAREFGIDHFGFGIEILLYSGLLDFKFFSSGLRGIGIIMFGKTNPHSDSRTNNCIIHSYASLMDTAIL
jgi:hypothetical protein